MQASNEEILADIDQTLDQMIKNAIALRQIEECEALLKDSATLHKIQNSLTGRVLHKQELLCLLGQEETKNEDTLRSEIRQKILNYKRLNNIMMDKMAESFLKMEQSKPVKRHPRIGHNRRKTPVHVASRDL